MYISVEVPATTEVAEKERKRNTTASHYARQRQEEKERACTAKL